MPDPLHIRIRSDWDAALTYDSLYDEESEKRPVFVGREVLIAPLVAEITEPNKRGTYLISGYRGTGKTTLLIEALSRAKKQLKARGVGLFPLVLNVSEISASLGSSRSELPVQLDIDPQRLLIALIRTIRESIKRRPDKNVDLTELAASVDEAYQKATAAKYLVSGKSSQEDVRTRAWELALAIEDKNVLKTLAALTGAAAIAFESAALIGPRLGWFHAAAVGLAAVFAVSLAASWRRGRSEKKTDTRETSVEHDYSLQHLETELKEILASLKKKGLRTVVVLEELDKIEDKEGKQLAAVIRYFKNLFTQAPALFFFVTDKSYFDIIASAIKRARRERSYAVEHTFFTHRIFVGRPTTEESLKFIAAIVEDEEQRRNVEAVANTLGKPGRIDEADQLGRFVRCVLFNAANHLFDLKNELRRFARNHEREAYGLTVRSTSFLIDDQTLPPEQAALAVFQDLIVEKSRSFEIKGGRAYANETLADSLYALFNELGSNQPQRIDSFLPETNQNGENALLLDEQLDLSELARVREAVDSMIGDLERGRAFQSRDVSANTFTWRDDAARAFRYVRQLQKHEEALIAELQRHVTLVDSLTGSGPRDPLAIDLEQRVQELRTAPEPLTADAAAAHQREVADRYRDVLYEVYARFIRELSAYGFIFEELKIGLDGLLYLVKSKKGDSRLFPSVPRGGVLLAFGNTEWMQADVWSFARPTSPSLAPLDRLALVQVLHTELNQDVNWQMQWVNFFVRQQNEIGTEILYAVDLVPLVNSELMPQLSEVQRVAASLAEFGAWANVTNRSYDWIPNTPPLTGELMKWRNTDASVFHIPGSILPTRLFTERDALEMVGDVVLRFYANTERSIAEYVGVNCMLAGFDQAFGGPDLWEPLGKWLLKEHRVYLYLDWPEHYNVDPQELRQAIAMGARFIIVREGPLPPGLEGVTFLLAPPPTEEPEPQEQQG